MIRRCLFACALACLAACSNASERGFEYAPDMVRGPAYKAFAPNPATRDGLTLQRPVAGTIARGYRPFHYGPGEDEAARAGRDLVDPFDASRPVVEEGGALYRSYCLVCHGPQGKGDGPISGKIPPPPSYLSDRILAFAPGRIFHVITRGSGKMASYAAQLGADDRWKIVTYIKVDLQKQGDAYEAHRRGAGP